MKIKFALAGFILCASIATIKAQSQNQKGSFVFGTNVVGYSFGTSRSTNDNGGATTDSTKSSYKTFTTGFNIWGGYFLSDRVCWGLSVTAPTYVFQPQAYVLTVTSYSTFFRYYLTHNDASKLDVYAEGSLGFGYNSINTNPYTEYTTNGGGGNSFSTIDYTAHTDKTSSINGYLGICASFHLSNHFSIGAMASFMGYATTQKISSYTEDNSNGGSPFTVTVPAQTNKLRGNSENLVLRLQFYM